ncbi:MAG: tetratricopeptide repeat protein [Desulfobacterales bacterium]
MTFWDLFSGSSPQKLEHKGDTLFDAGLWGQAKQEYERALDKLENIAKENRSDFQRISEKISLAGEALAKEHQQSALNYLDGGYIEEARQMLLLAFEVSEDDQFKTMVEGQLQEIEGRQSLSVHVDDLSENFLYGLENDDDINDDNYHELSEQTSEDEEFSALCNTLPAEVCNAYHGYGRHFKTGLVALNQGDFQTAAVHLKQAMEENPQPGNYIALEMASLYLNLDQPSKARALLEDFLPYHPDALPAYQLLCEIYWEQEDFSEAEFLLESVPDELSQSLAVVLLKGETLYQRGSYKEAKSFFESFLATYGWHEAVARKLAKTCEALDETDIARNIYKKLIGNCTGCHSRVDPIIRDRYAELSFTAGVYSSDILEIYLSLAREIPEQASRYFDRVSRIYTAQGNAREAERFRQFSARSKRIGY